MESLCPIAMRHALRGGLSAVLLLASACGGGEAAAPPAPKVVVAPVAKRDVPIVSEWIGTTEGSVDAEVRSRVSGNLIRREYQEGTRVGAGDLLFVVDPRPYAAALDQARGQLAHAQAVLEKARLDVERYTPLASEGAVSQQELDNAVQAKLAGEADVLSARAALEQAELDLEFSEVRSPIDGIVGVARRQLGDLVGPSDPEPLTTISNVDPIRVIFPLSEREYLQFAAAIRRVVDGGTAAGPQDKGVALELVLTDGSIWPHKGIAVPASERIDSRTGTILIRGEFANPDGMLRPGQYARVRAVTEVRSGALLVPQRAVQELQGVQQLAVVGKDDKVALRVVQTGPRSGSDWVIESGVEDGERVVVEGVQKVRDGLVVEPTTADTKAAPAPAKGD